MTLTPYLGRDYKSKKAVLADWNAGKDFYGETYNTPRMPTNKSQVDADPKINRLTFRYQKLTKVFTHDTSK